MGSARGAHNGGGVADVGLVTSVSALTSTMVRIPLANMISEINCTFPRSCNAETSRRVPWQRKSLIVLAE